MSDADPAPPQRLPHRRWAGALALGFSWYWLTLLPVVGGVWFGVDFLTTWRNPNEAEPGFVEAFAVANGPWYIQIAEEGYFYEPGEQSSVAFFPTYPFAGRIVSTLTGLSTTVSLLIVAHVSLAAAFVLLAAYTHRRYPSQSRLPEYTLIVFGLLPTTLCFRMTYTESLFLVTMLVAMWGMLVRWPALAVALVIGLATATRPVGVALLLPWIWDLWERSSSWKGFIGRAVLLVPLACWGLLSYMLYQAIAFGDPLAFVHTQGSFTPRPSGTSLEYVTNLLLFKPLWAVYVPGDPAYWANGTIDSPLFNLRFVTPLFFGGTVLLIIIGAFKGWLDRREWLLGAGLLLIPYLTHSLGSLSMSDARYAAVVFPVFPVLGRLLWKLPVPIQLILCGYSTFLLAIYSALFVSLIAFY